MNLEIFILVTVWNSANYSDY